MREFELEDFYEYLVEPSWQFIICQKIGGEQGVQFMEEAMVSTMQKMLDLGMDPNRKDEETGLPVWTFLIARKEVPPLLIDYMINHGATFSTSDNEGERILAKALKEHGDAEVIKLLIAHGADPKFMYPNNATALHFACSNFEASLDTIKLLVEHGCPINLQEIGHYYSPLMLGILSDCSYEILEYLIQAGADFHQYDRSGYSAAGMLCRCYRDARLLKLLYKCGLNLNKKEQGYTLLMIAAMNENWRMVKELFLLGYSDVGAVDRNSGKTALELTPEKDQLMLYGLMSKFRLSSKVKCPLN